LYFAVDDLPDPGIRGLISETQLRRVEFWTNNMKALHRLIEDRRKLESAKKAAEANNPDTSPTP
jgi:hypothetical protein